MSAISIKLPEKMEFDKALFSRLKVAMKGVEKSIETTHTSIAKSLNESITFGKAPRNLAAARVFIKMGTEMGALLTAIDTSGSVFASNPKDWDKEIVESMERLLKTLAYIDEIISECKKKRVEISNINLSSKDNITLDFLYKATGLQISAEVNVEIPLVGVGVYGEEFGIEVVDVPNNAQALIGFVIQEIADSKRQHNVDDSYTW